MKPLSVLSRAFSSNIKAIPLAPEEETELASRGFQEPTIQRYVVWRRATLLMVVAATILSAGVTTYTTLTESDDEPEIVETIQETLLQKLAATAPSAATFLKSNAEPISKAAKTVDKPEEKTESTSEEDGRKSGEKKEPLLGRVVDGMHLLSLYAMPVAAVIVLLLGDRFRLAYRILVAAFLFSFFAPMLVAICPWSLWEPQVPLTNPAEIVRDQAEGLMEGITTMAVLLPSVLSLIPGVQRACLRIKTLLPESWLPGWLIVVASALYGLFLIVIFVAVDQVTSLPAILLSLGLLALASLTFAFRASVFTQPLLSEADYRRMRTVQQIVGLITAAAGIILVVFVIKTEVLGIHLVGLDPDKSLLRPIEVVEYLLEIIARSMFVSALGAELILRMNLKSWKQTRTVSTSGAGTLYDRTMEGLTGVVRG